VRLRADTPRKFKEDSDEMLDWGVTGVICDQSRTSNPYIKWDGDGGMVFFPITDNRGATLLWLNCEDNRRLEEETRQEAAAEAV
jgi:2-polyprenyl-6-methoxyphenol hydroxylase-like FAD-dependent oxidoreductase